MTVTQQLEPEAMLAQSIGPACHELRSPLAVVYGFAKMLEGLGGIDETTARYASEIVNGAQRLDDLLDYLAAIGRIAAGRMKPHVSSHSLRDLLDVAAQENSAHCTMAVAARDSVHIAVDDGWFADALSAVIDSCCVDAATVVRVEWESQPHEVRIRFTADPAFMEVDFSIAKSTLRMALAQVKFATMGGSLLIDDEVITLTVPR